MSLMENHPSRSSHPHHHIYMHIFHPIQVIVSCGSLPLIRPTAAQSHSSPISFSNDSTSPDAPHLRPASTSPLPPAHHGCSNTWLIVILFSTSRSSISLTRSMLSSLITHGTRRSWSMISSML